MKNSAAKTLNVSYKMGKMAASFIDEKSFILYFLLHEQKTVFGLPQKNHPS